VLDASFNFQEEIANPEIKFNRYASIYIYSEDNEQNIPKAKKVGDIIRLRRFNFVVSENGELIGHQQKYSNWLIYDGEDVTNSVVSCQNISKNVGRVFTKTEEAAIKGLREWTDEFFQNNSVHQIAWWNGLKEPMIPELAIKNKEKASEVDLVLQTTKIEEKIKRVTFIDYKKNVYYLILYTAPVLKIGDVIKLKCVDVFFTKDGRYVRLTPTTSCLSIFSNSFDAQVFNKDFPQEKLSGLQLISPFRIEEDDDNYYNTRKKVLSKFPFLKNYNFDDCLINERYLSLEDKTSDMVSASLSLIHFNYINRIPMDLSYLKDLLYGQSRKDVSSYVHQRFVVKASLESIVNNKAPDMIKKHCNKCSNSIPLNTNQFECCGVLMDLYFHMIFLMNDSFGETEVPVYVIIGKNEHLFDLWELIPRPDDYKGFLEWETIELFNRKMESLVESPLPLEMVVELKLTVDGTPFFKLVDTILLP
jgi:hypothetical protein